MQSTIRSAMSFVPLNQGANLAPRERLIPLAAAAATTTSILGKGQRSDQPPEKLAALAKKRGI